MQTEVNMVICNGTYELSFPLSLMNLYKIECYFTAPDLLSAASVINPPYFYSRTRKVAACTTGDGVSRHSSSKYMLELSSDFLFFINLLLVDNNQRFTLNLATMHHLDQLVDLV